MNISSLLNKLGKSGGKSGQTIAPPVLSAPNRFPYGPFEFKARITKNVPYEIQSSSDLKNWSTILTATPVEETVDYIDSEASKFSYRFYRIKSEGVISQNVIGYVSVTVPPAFSMVANPLNAASNVVGDLFKGQPDGTTLNKFDTRLHKLTENVVKNGRWTNPLEKLAPGEGAIFYNPTSEYTSVDFVGEAMTGNLFNPIPAGFSIRSSMVPQPGRLHADLAFPIAEGDTIHIFDKEQQKYVLYPYDAAKWASNPPIIGMGESFWVAKTSPGNWVRNFAISS